MQPVAEPPRKVPRVLVITNDSTVFLKQGFVSASDMFGGRAAEVKGLVEKLSGVCDASLAFISGKFGFVPSNYVVMQYANVPSCREDYEELQRRKDFVGHAGYIARAFDRTVLCVPKDMFAMMMDAMPPGKVIAVTSRSFKAECRKRGWSFYERKGPRVGEANADAIVAEVAALSEGASGA